MSDARQLYPMSCPIRTLVTTRTEQNQSQTEAWAAVHDIIHGELSMATADIPVRRGAAFWQSRFKAHTYRHSSAEQFMTPQTAQTQIIAGAAAKPVMCPNA
ncbi:hypothetical protein RM533_11965 [Croceicoccus sp. F390]|uniref:Uncharacterized protein n=1 Tax=Croceicoccus esteveae TaxID=3075597 RepID=A0ABU2ZKI5_9SPHN|nr:hypothetical protein [Croceicoccus sp. F390]MDT0576886.1 hypothetical protein [Croceicoccus sp. F390]